MQSITKKLFLTLVAVCVMSVVGTATASAYTNPILVNEKGEAVSTTFTSKANNVGRGEEAITIVPTGETVGIDCEESGTGTIKTTGTGTARKTSGESSVKFTDCSSPLGGVCSTKGDKAGEITTTVSFSLVWLGKESEKKPGILMSSGPEGKLKITCSGQAVEVTGWFVSRSRRALGTAFTTDGFEAKETGGVQEEKKYTEEGKEAANNIWWGFEEKKTNEMGVATENELTFKEKVKIVES
jgi:hypothetical protein